MQLMGEETELVADDPVDQDSAVAVLKQQMIWHRDQSAEICQKIIDKLKENNARGDLIAMMYKYMSEANKIVIDCAAKLAPYESPRLESIEVKKTITNRFVIQAPRAFDNNDTWLANTKKELLQIEQIKNEAEDATVLPQ